MSAGEEKHGVVFYDPKRGFIQVRDRYFTLKAALCRNADKELQTGHFVNCLGDAKNNVHLGKITPRDLIGLINIEEVGLINIPQAVQHADGEWWCSVERVCPTCGKYYNQ